MHLRFVTLCMVCNDITSFSNCFDIDLVNVKCSYNKIIILEN